MAPHRQFAAELVACSEIEGYARGYGLDFFPTIFEFIDADELNAIAAYGGFPTSAIRTGGSAWSTSSSARATTTGCKRSTRW